MKKVGNILWGVVLIVIGVIFALNALGITSIDIFFDGWWTLFIIIPSFIGLIKNDNKTWSLIWLIIGILILLSVQNIISFDIIGKLLIPIVLVIIGLSLIFRDTINKRVSDKIKTLNASGEKEEYCSTFGSQNVNFSGKDFNGANIDAIFGSVDFNLENSTVLDDKVINATAVFGKIEITAPSNVNIKVKSTPIFGSTQNKVKKPYDEHIPTIYINSVAIFGGVDIK